MFVKFHLAAGNQRLFQVVGRLMLQRETQRRIRHAIVL